jgi:hypothetical protein
VERRVFRSRVVHRDKEGNTALCFGCGVREAGDRAVVIGRRGFMGDTRIARDSRRCTALRSRVGKETGDGALAKEVSLN